MMLTGIGIDVEDIQRWEDALRHGDSMQRRGFSDKEIAYCMSTDQPAAAFAARWCAKEACIKALWSVVQLTVRDIEVEHEADGRPSVVLREDIGAPVPDIHVSISHSSAYATAIVVAMGVQAPT